MGLFLRWWGARHTGEMGCCVSLCRRSQSASQPRWQLHTSGLPSRPLAGLRETVGIAVRVVERAALRSSITNKYYKYFEQMLPQFNPHCIGAHICCREGRAEKAPGAMQLRRLLVSKLRRQRHYFHIAR